MTEEERKKRHREYAKKYRDKNKHDLAYKEQRAKLNREWIEKNRVRYNEAKAEYRFSLKYAAIEYYSGGKMECAHCGYNEDIDALCLDHINDDGAKHRRELGCSSRGTLSGTTIYERLKAVGWMDGLQVLCFNCNTIKELRRKRGGKKSSELIKVFRLPRKWKREDNAS